ncbi:MAG: flagellin lysine-N-methylase [Lachnospiraceae bacterium]|nr:flagellin lysine-N-methylase [Lachnospiraceae bacterium]
MKIHKIEWFDEFECIGGECPQTCCKGWLIPLDEEDLLRYRKERGRLTLSLFTATAGFTRNRINLCSGKCRFHTRDGLCRLQLKKGHDFIPWACRSFPRFYRNYGEFEERYLDLSCIAAARIFVRNMGSMRIISEAATAPETKPCTTNDDMAYLNTLLKMREDIIRTVLAVYSEDVTENNSVLTTVFSYVCHIQDLYAGGCEEIQIPAFHDYCSQWDKPACKPQTDTSSSGKSSVFPLRVNMMSCLTETIKYYFGQKKTGTALYGLLSDAQDILADYRRKDVDIAVKINEILASGTPLSMLPGAYLSYYMYQYFLDAYETYSLRRITALGIIHTNMILFLILVLSEKRTAKSNKTAASEKAMEVTGESMTEGRKTADISMEDIAYIIALYNRKAYFNETIQNNLYKIFEEMT